VTTGAIGGEQADDASLFAGVGVVAGADRRGCGRAALALGCLDARDGCGVGGIPGLAAFERLEKALKTTIYSIACG